MFARRLRRRVQLGSKLRAIPVSKFRVSFANEYEDAKTSATHRSEDHLGQAESSRSDSRYLSHQIEPADRPINRGQYPID